MSNVKGNSKTDFARFGDLTRPEDPDIYGSFERMAKLLEGSGITGKVQFTILDGATWKPFTLDLAAGKVRVQNKQAKPDLEILTKRETWEQMARGTLAPIEAFVTGKMRVRGNYKLGPKIIRHLAASPGRIDIC